MQDERLYSAGRLQDFPAVRLPSGTVGIFHKYAITTPGVHTPSMIGIVRTTNYFGSVEVGASDMLALVAGPERVSMQWLEHYRDES